MSFPEHFTWGATASSYQIEGAWDEDGKGPSIWDMFAAEPSRIWEGHSGKIACDHYHRTREDVALMKKIGLKAYRLSISWPRVIPGGTGRANPKGLDFYDRLVDELLANGIEPWITLFHWDYPYELFLRGGWLNPESPQWFAKYTATVVRRLSDRVRHWITVNEPQCFIAMGHLTGEHAPGFKLNFAEGLLAGHHCLLAHGRAVETIRACARRTPVIGWSPAASVFYPTTSAPEDAKAARQATLDIYPGSVWNNRWWGDPVVFGRYPEEGLRAYGRAAPRATQADFKIIRQPIDFYGCNIFQGFPVKADPEGTPVPVSLPPGHPRTQYLWPKTPESLYWGPRFLAEHYRLPIVVTENGMSNSDTVGLDGRVHDPDRIEFMSRYLLQLRRAIRDGVDVRGYFCWSIMDNFEWQEGFKHRFGLIHVDYETQHRTLKDSALWYNEVISSNGGSLEKLISDDRPSPPYVIKETMRYVDSRVHEPFNIKDLAAHLHCHPDFLSRKFKQYAGIDLSLYIRQARVDHARELLKNPELLIDDVAEQSGFADRVHFTKVFRRLTGQTPGQFQRRFRVGRETPPPAPRLTPRTPRSTSV